MKANNLETSFSIYVALYIAIYTQSPIIHTLISSSYHYTNTIRLSYAFKVRQDYLSTCYLDQKYLPSERSETREIWIDPSNVCWDNPVSFWMHMMIFFSHLSLFNRWNILKIWEKLSKWNLDGGPSHLRASYVLTTYFYTHHVSSVCTPYASNVGDVPEYFIHLTYVRQRGSYHIHDQGEMCFERSIVSHDYSAKRCEKKRDRDFCSFLPHSNL